LPCGVEEFLLPCCVLCTPIERNLLTIGSCAFGSCAFGSRTISSRW
jgi:hypothetical protein